MEKQPENLQPAHEEQIKIKKGRITTEAELLEGGADYEFDEGSTEPRLTPTPDQIAAIELEMRSDFEKKKDSQEEKKKTLQNVILPTLKSNPTLSSILYNYQLDYNHEGATRNSGIENIEDQKRYNLENALRHMSVDQIEQFLKSLEAEQVYLTSHTWEQGINEGEKIRLWIKPPTKKDYPDWGSNPGGGLAEGGIESRSYKYAETKDELEQRRKVGHCVEELVDKLTKVEEAPYDVVEEVVIKDEKKKHNPFKGPAEYKRWLLKRKPKNKVE